MKNKNISISCQQEIIIHVEVIKSHNIKPKRRRLESHLYAPNTNGNHWDVINDGHLSNNGSFRKLQQKEQLHPELNVQTCYIKTDQFILQ